MGTQLPFPKKGAEPPSFWPMSRQMAGWIKMALGVEVGLGPGHIVLDGDRAPPPQLPVPQKGGRAPIFGPFLLWPNGWMHQDATWYGGRPRPRDIVLDVGFWATVCKTASSPQKGHSPQLPFSAHVFCRQMAVCIRIPLSVQVCFSLSDIVLDGDPAPPPLKGYSPPIFG